MFCFVYQSYLLLAEKFFHKISRRGLSIICLNFNCIFIFYYEFFEGFYAYMSLGGGGEGGGGGGLKYPLPPYEIFLKGYPPPT